MITQHISRMVGGTALPQVTVQVDFQLNSCTQMNNCGRSFSIHKYETSNVNATAARNLSNYEFVPPRITPTDGSGDVRENSSVQINFATAATGCYLGIRDETSCILVHRVLVLYYVCPAETSDLITRPEVIAPFIGNSAPIVVNGQCVENSSSENGIGPRLTCSQNGVWGGLGGAGCVCDTGFQRSLDGRSCVGTFLSDCLSIYLFIDLPLVLLYTCTTKVVMLGCTCPQTLPVSPVLLTATAHNKGCLSAPALRDTSELLENLQKESVLVCIPSECTFRHVCCVEPSTVLSKPMYKCGNFVALNLCLLYARTHIYRAPLCPSQLASAPSDRHHSPAQLGPSSEQWRER